MGPPVAEWIEHILALKRRYHLSPRALAEESMLRERTEPDRPPSRGKSSWQDYITGKRLPPTEKAVLMMCQFKRIPSDETMTTMVLYRRAVAALDPQPPPDVPARQRVAPPSRGHRVMVVLAALVAVLLPAATARDSEIRPADRVPGGVDLVLRKMIRYYGVLVIMELRREGSHVRAFCSVTEGQRERSIRGCNVFAEPRMQLTITERMNPVWPAVDSSHASAWSTATLCPSTGTRYFVAVLFDLAGVGTRISLQMAGRARSC
jgi:hypothetical protein